MQGTGELLVQETLVIDLGETFQLGGTLGAAHGLDRDLTLAVGTDLGGGLCGGLFRCGLFVQAVDGLDHDEQYKGDDQEIDDGVYEVANFDAGTAQTDDNIRKVRIKEQTDKRVDDIIYQRVHDGRERRADDHTDCRAWRMP